MDSMTQSSIPIRSALLVSDVHLSHDQPLLTQGFFHWLAQHTIAAHARPQALFVLGDLVDAWVGDDQITAASESGFEQQLCELLRKIQAADITVYFLHGNRDFLIGQNFASATGTRLLHDPIVIDVQPDATAGAQPTPRRIALTHGDQLCTNDHAYQAFRQQVREPKWQAEFLAKPLAARLQIAQQLRAQSEIEKSSKSTMIMDITPSQAQSLTDDLNVDLLIHGHTHRPGHYILPNGKSRWVLPDWDVDATGQLTRGGGLWVDAAGIQPVEP